MPESLVAEFEAPLSKPKDVPRDAEGSRPLFPSKVPLAAPCLPSADAVLQAFGDLLGRSCLTNAAAVARLEQQAARFLGVDDCVAVSSCTSGLMLVERCLNLQGEVIVPSFTFFATAHGLLWNGLKPVFVDCGPDDFNIDPAQVERAVTPRTKAILAVHMFGCAAAVESLQEIARRRGVRLIFDAAHAFGAETKGRSVAQWGDATVFSLSPTKPLVAGEGGLIAVRDPELARRLRQARNYGKGESYDCEILGLNARMTEFQAALALLGLPLVRQAIEHRNRLAALYRGRFQNVPGLATQKISCSHLSSYKDFAVLVDSARFGISRDKLEAALSADNVEVRRYFDPPLHQQILYQAYRPADPRLLAVTERISNRVLCLPLHAGLRPETVAMIADRVVSLAKPSNHRTERSGESTFRSAGA